MKVSANTPNMITEVTPRTLMAGWMVPVILGGNEEVPKILKGQCNGYIDIKTLYDHGWDCVTSTIEGKRIGLIRDSKQRNVIYYCQREELGKRIQVYDNEALAELRMNIIRIFFWDYVELAEPCELELDDNDFYVSDYDIRCLYCDDDVSSDVTERLVNIDFGDYAPGVEFDLPWGVMYSILSIGTNIENFPCADSYNASYIASKYRVVDAHLSVRDQYQRVHTQHTMTFVDDNKRIVASVTMFDDEYQGRLVVYDIDEFWDLYKDILKSGV